MVQILRSHPIYDSKWKAVVESLPADKQGPALFMLASSWPDDIKNDYTYRLPLMTRDDVKTKLNPQHFVDYAYVPPHQHVIGEPVPNISILSAIPENLKRLHDGPDDSDRAVALCWVLHLMGDAHQPLHCVSKFTDIQPDGDAGGNFDFVTIPAPTHAHPAHTAIQEIHAYWDNVLGPASLLGKPNMPPHFDVPESRADDLMAAYPRSHISYINHGNLSAWTNTSKNFAKHYAYLNGTLVYQPTQSFDDPKPKDAPPLPDGYEAQMNKTARKQLAIAGYRLAEALRSNAP
jgi:hypothetical protein